MTEKKRPWYRMDNASVLYSSLQKEEYSANYRFSAVMSEQVQPEALQRAIDIIMPRFPGFRVKIKKGFFWYYFEPNKDAPGPFLKKDVSEPCRPMRFDEDNSFLIRFYYYERRISIEIFHALSDGSGALSFFRCLLRQYLIETGHDIPLCEGMYDPALKSTPEEWEDAYTKYLGKTCRAQKIIKKAYLNIGTPEKFYTFNVTMGFMRVDQLKEKARALGVSITEYLAAVLLYVLREKQRRERPVRELPLTLSVPVNLRPFFPSKTLRNFIITVQPYLDPALGEYSFEEVAALVHHYMRIHCMPQEMRAAFSRNVRLQSSLFLKLIPRVLKNPIMALSYRTVGMRPYSANFTNPGAFKVSPEMEPFIEHMEVIQGQATVPRPHLAAISYKNIMELSFSGTMQESGLERDFFRFLVRQGIAVHIESNRQRGCCSQGGK